MPVLYRLCIASKIVCPQKESGHWVLIEVIRFVVIAYNNYYIYLIISISHRLVVCVHTTKCGCVNFVSMVLLTMEKANE